MADDFAPLPFSSPSTGPTFKYRFEAERNALIQKGRLLLRDTGADGGFNVVRDIKHLVGNQVFSELEIRGEIGGQTLDQNLQGTGADQNTIRTPWVLTCQTWINEGRYIIARVNPREVQWRMPQRSAPQKTRIGEILHVWKDRFRDTFYDEPTIQLTFQSGNIMPIRKKPLVPDIDFKETEEPGVTRAEVQTAPGPTEGSKRVKFKPDPSEQYPTVPTGLDNFYEFLQLVDEQKIQDSGDVNFVYIMYNSRMFPSLTLAGLFTPDGVSWSDNADDPNQVSNWSANFTIYDSYPRLHDLNTLRQFFRDAGFGRI